jgi:hypothetical protein
MEAVGKDRRSSQVSRPGPQTRTVVVHTGMTAIAASITHR